MFIPIYSNFWVGTPPVANVANFVYIYLLIGYLEKWNRQVYFEKYALIGSILITLSIIVGLWFNLILPASGIKGMIKNFLPFTFANMNRHSLIILVDSLMIFYLFKNIKIKSFQIINSVAMCTLGVYLFHENPTFIPMSKLVNRLLSGIMNCESNTIAFLLYCIIGCTVLFFGGVIVEILRRVITTKCKIKFVKFKYEKEIERINNYFSKV